jgi:hypothetical protein
MCLPFCPNINNQVAVESIFRYDGKMNVEHDKPAGTPARIVPGLVLLNLLLAGGLYMIYASLPLPALPLCVHPVGRSILLALGTTLLLDLIAAVLLGRAWIAPLRIPMLVMGILWFLALWLGSYPYSPLKLSAGILTGFQVTTRGHINELVQPGGIIVLASDSATGLNVLTSLPVTACYWSSLNGGAWDGEDSCDPTYAAPVADYDILTVRMTPACGLPTVRGQLKISILP